MIYETALQRTIAPEKLSRVSSFNWLVAMSVLPLGYALAGPVAEAIGASTYLWIGAIWVVVSAIAVALVPSVRNLRTDVPPRVRRPRERSASSDLTMLARLAQALSRAAPSASYSAAESAYRQ